MPYSNRVNLLGHVETVTIERGFVKLILRTKENYRPSGGEAKDTFADCQCSEKFGGKLAELPKGALVFVEGEIRGREYNGRYYTNVGINNFAILWKSQPSNNAAPQQRPASQPPPQQQAPKSNTGAPPPNPVHQDGTVDGIEGDDIPF